VPIFVRDGVRLAYEVRGTGDPVVLLHGFTSLGSTWERNGLVQLLVDHDLQIVTPDARSHGSSDAVFTPAMCTTTVLADDVRALLDHLAMDAAAIVGFSMGGAVALRVALDTPARVTRLVIAGVGDAAINALHNPEEVRALADAFSGERKPEKRQQRSADPAQR
jgi:pimeloyl-ACP methyl ester carboxylesterase